MTWGNIAEVWTAFRRLAAAVCDEIETQPPDLVVYVRRSLKTLRERIEMRGRDYEKNIPDEYLLQLNRCYDEWIGNYDLGKVLTLDADDLDFRDEPDHFDYVCEQIENSLDQPGLWGKSTPPPVLESITLN